MTIGNKMALGFGVLLTLMATFAIVVLFHLSNIDRQFSFAIQHDAPVIANARHLLTLVIDMETGQRGYVITGKDEFLEPYEEALASLADLFQVEKTLVGDNPSQVRLLEEIEDSVQEWQEKAGTPEISMRQKVGEAGVESYLLQEILSEGASKRLMDRFMALSYEIKRSFREQRDWEGALAVEIIEQCMTVRDDGRRDFLNTGQEKFLSKYYDGQSKLPEYFARLRLSVSATDRKPELLTRIARLEELSAEWSRNGTEPEIATRRRMNDKPESLSDLAALFERGPGKKIIDRIRALFKKFIDEEERLTTMRFASATQESRSTLNTTLLLVIVSLISGAVMAAMITRGITKPVRKLAGALRMVSTGDLHQSIEIESKDEIGGLSRSFNRMVGNLKRLEEDRAQSAGRLRQARQAADAASSAKSEFLANMSHEIRTPMTAILGFAENMLDADQSESERLSCIHTIRRNGDHLLGLINDILDLSKIEAGKMVVELRPCHPCRLLAEVASLMSVRAEAKDIPLNIDYIGVIPETIQSDATRVRQILINLIGNAIKFTEVGCVRVVARLVENNAESFLQFDVIDTGRGMTDEQVAKLFRPFIQADTSTTRNFGGTGLGLTISKRFAELLGGDISVLAAEIGVGSTFRATVATGPLHGVTMLDDPLSATEVADNADTVTQATRASLNGCRILLAEDGPDNQRLISYVLKKAGAEVTIVENGKLASDAALAPCAEGDPFHVILMDMQMPVMDGYEATARLRGKGYPGPIVALTAHAMACDRQKCIDAGCDDYATKPIDRQKLIETVASHLLATSALGT